MNIDLAAVAVLMQEDKDMLHILKRTHTKGKKIPKAKSASFVEWMSRQEANGYKSIDDLIKGVEGDIKLCERMISNT